MSLICRLSKWRFCLTVLEMRPPSYLPGCKNGYKRLSAFPLGPSTQKRYLPTVGLSGVGGGGEGRGARRSLFAWPVHPLVSFSPQSLRTCQSSPPCCSPWARPRSACDSWLAWAWAPAPSPEWTTICTSHWVRQSDPLQLLPFHLFLPCGFSPAPALCPLPSRRTQCWLRREGRRRRRRGP